jgi:hypothetical protein
MLGWSRFEFYIYFSDEGRSEPLTSALMHKGFRIESRSSEEDGWLVLAIKRAHAFELPFLESSLEHLAAEYGGDYDGYSRAV